MVALNMKKERSFGNLFVWPALSIRLIMGDFNQVLSADEKCGRKGVNPAQCKQLLDCLNYCNLMDVELAGPKLTWNNNGDGINYTRVKLDRVVANELWFELFPSYRAAT